MRRKRAWKMAVDLCNWRKNVTFVKFCTIMASELRETLERIRNKSEVLLEKYDTLRSERDGLAMKIEEMQSELEQMRKENERLRRDYEYMKMARTLAPDMGDVEHYRSIIGKLVRDIDKSIAQLNE